MDIDFWHVRHNWYAQNGEPRCGSCRNHKIMQPDGQDVKDGYCGQIGIYLHRDTKVDKVPNFVRYVGGVKPHVEEKMNGGFCPFYNPVK